MRFAFCAQVPTKLYKLTLLFIYDFSGGGRESQTRYLADVLQLFEGRGLHWAYWFWKDPWGEQHCVSTTPQGTKGYQYAVVCQLDNGTEHHNAGALQALGDVIGSV